MKRLSAATHVAEAGEALRAAVGGYGFENLALVRTHSGVTTDVPWNWMPTDFAEAYMTLHWEKHDPELYYACQSQLPFTWAELPNKIRMTEEQFRFFNAAPSFNLHGGLCIPMHGAGGHLDMVTLSSLHKSNGLEPAKLNAIAMLTLHAMQRFVEISDAHDVPSKNSAPSPARARPAPLLDDFIRHNRDTPFTLPVEHLRALALIEAGARRWKMGLTKLASGLYLMRNAQPYAELERWGFIVDVPDDVRWRYYLAPSVLGHSYLRRAPESPQLAHEIWSRNIDKCERPDGREGE